MASLKYRILNVANEQWSIAAKTSETAGNEKYPVRRVRFREEMVIFVTSYLTCVAPQKAEIRTVAKSLPKPS